MNVRKDTEKLFDQDKQYVQEYLQSRGINDVGFNRIYDSMDFGLIENAEFAIGDELYEISHFLSKSDNCGYDIKKLNALMNLEKTEDVAFALVIGDDILCYNIQTKKIYLWLIQTSEGEKIVAFDSLNDMLKKFKI